MVTSYTRLPERVNPILANTHLVSTLSWSCDFVPGPQPATQCTQSLQDKAYHCQSICTIGQEKKKDER